MVDVFCVQLKICIDGKIKTRTRKSVEPGYPLLGRDTGPGKGGSSTALHAATTEGCQLTFRETIPNSDRSVVCTVLLFPCSSRPARFLLLRTVL